jgi:crossover junction endodeoxyribonuclease RuvC
VICGVLSTPSTAAFPDKLKNIHTGLTELFSDVAPDCVAVENLFHARNVRSALILGHARGVAVLAAVMAGLPVVEYSPAEIKLAVSGYGRAPKPQLGQMVKMLLGLDKVPAPHDAADALAVAICHAHSQGPIAQLEARTRGSRRLTSWRHVPLAALSRRQAP